MRGAITNDFIAVTLDGELRGFHFGGSRVGKIRGMTERIPVFAFEEEAFPLEKIWDTQRQDDVYLARAHRPIT